MPQFLIRTGFIKVPLRSTDLFVRGAASGDEHHVKHGQAKDGQEQQDTQDHYTFKGIRNQLVNSLQQSCNQIRSSFFC